MTATRTTTKSAKRAARRGEALASPMSPAQLRYWWWQKREAERQKKRDQGAGTGTFAPSERVLAKQSSLVPVSGKSGSDQKQALPASPVSSFLAHSIAHTSLPSMLKQQDHESLAGAEPDLLTSSQPYAPTSHKTAPAVIDPHKSEVFDFLRRPVDRLDSQIALAANRVNPNGYGRLWPMLQKNQWMPDPHSFNFAAHSDAFEHGSVVNVYQACTPGLARLAREAKLFVMKIGMTARDPSARLRELNLDHYAGLIQGPNGYERCEGWQNWEALRIFAPDTARAANSPVYCLPRCLQVSLPTGLAPDRFDMMLREALDPVRLDLWIDTPNGDLHCRRHFGSKSSLRRLTAHHRQDGGLVIRPATELYVFRPEDAHLLIELSEAVIAQHLLREAMAVQPMTTRIVDKLPTSRGIYGSLRGVLRIRLNP